MKTTTSHIARLALAHQRNFLRWEALSLNVDGNNTAATEPLANLKTRLNVV